MIPTLMSVYLLIKRELWVKGLFATAVVALVIHWMADPVPGLGIAEPVFIPVLVTAVVALLLSRKDAPPLAYIAGGLGTLIGADLTNLDKVVYAIKVDDTGLHQSAQLKQMVPVTPIVRTARLRDTARPNLTGAGRRPGDRSQVVQRCHSRCDQDRRQSRRCW